VAELGEKILSFAAKDYPGAKKMPDIAKKIAQIGAPEQDFGQNEPEFPWLRKKNEPANWYMRFKRYLDLGPKRSLRKALATEPMEQKATKGDTKQSEPKKLSDVSIPGSWSRASKMWNWEARAAAYDFAQTEKQAATIRKTVVNSAYASKAYRILKLDYLARLLLDQIQGGMNVNTCLAVTARYQSVLHDIAKEMEVVI
jgi:hypothetical protein